MADKLSILLFKILICILISFKTKSQLVDEESIPNNLTEEELEQLIKDLESLSFEQIDNIYADESLPFQQIENIEAAQPDIPFDQISNMESESHLLGEESNRTEELEQVIKDIESLSPEQIGNIYADESFPSKEIYKIDKLMAAQPRIPFEIANMDSELKRFEDIEDFSKKFEDLSFKSDEFKPIEYKPYNYRYGVARFTSSDVPVLILCYVAYFGFAFVFVLLISLVARCVKKKTPSPSNNRVFLWFRIKKTDSDQEETPGDGSGSQESSGDKNRLINV